MPPRVDKSGIPATYTFLIDTASPSLNNADPSQVTPPALAVASSSNPSPAEPMATFSTFSMSTPSSPTIAEGSAAHTTSTTRPRSKSTRGGSKKREASGHIPRPPNAFILFRSAFIRSGQIPDEVEGNHSNLSKIIGHAWRNLPKDERDMWEAAATKKLEEHRREFTDWRFRPGPYTAGKSKGNDGASRAGRRRSGKTGEVLDANDSELVDEVVAKSKGKGKGKEKESVRSTETNDIRCATIAGFLAKGIKGSRLTTAIQKWESSGTTADTQPTTPRDDHRRLTPVQSPSASPIASSPDRQSLSSNSAHERSRDLSQSPTSSQSPSTAISFDVSAPQLDALPGGAYPKPTHATIPLTRMFAHPQSSPPRSSPSIADMCPSRFEPERPVLETTSSAHTHHPSPLHPSPTTYQYPREAAWGRDEYEAQPGDGYWPSWSPPASHLPDASSEKRRFEPAPPREMGYETDATLTGYDAYGKLPQSFNSSDLPRDGSEVTNWTSSTSRIGMLATIDDPLEEPPLFATQFNVGNSNPATHSSEHPPPQSTYYYQQLPGSHLPMGMPSTGASYTLGGWDGGDYDYSLETRESNHPGQHGDIMGSDLSASSKHLPSPDWFSAPSQWAGSSGQDHQMGITMSSDDWDKVEAFDSRTSA